MPPCGRGGPWGDPRPGVARTGDVCHSELVSISGKLKEISAGVRRLGSPIREAVAGGLVIGLVGCVVGFVIGQVAYPPTALVAAVELGIPSAVVGAFGGLLVGFVVRLVAHVRA